MAGIFGSKKKSSSPMAVAKRKIKVAENKAKKNMTDALVAQVESGKITAKAAMERLSKK